MKLLEKVCEELGVKVGEEWAAKGGDRYRINDNGTLSYMGNADIYWFEVVDWSDILAGRVKPIWIPQKGDTYYIPNVGAYKKIDRYIPIIWENNKVDNHYINTEIVFKTKEEAIECASKMLKAMKE